MKRVLSGMADENVDDLILASKEEIESVNNMVASVWLNTTENFYIIIIYYNCTTQFMYVFYDYSVLY